MAQGRQSDAVGKLGRAREAAGLLLDLVTRNPNVPASVFGQLARQLQSERRLEEALGYARQAAALGDRPAGKLAERIETRLQASVGPAKAKRSMAGGR